MFFCGIAVSFILWSYRSFLLFVRRHLCTGISSGGHNKWDHTGSLTSLGVCVHSCDATVPLRLVFHLEKTAGIHHSFGLL